MKEDASDKKIVFYDSYCGICDFSVRFLMKHNKNRILFFAPIGGTYFKQLIEERYLKLDTIIFYDHKKVYIKSTGALKALIALGGWFLLIKIFLIFPTFIRDVVYDLIAKNRKKNDCPYIQTKDQNILN